MTNKYPTLHNQVHPDEKKGRAWLFQHYKQDVNNNTMLPTEHIFHGE